MLVSIERRAAVHAALGEPVRLAIVDRLGPGDASPGELAEAVGLASNLLAHHLKVLDEARWAVFFAVCRSPGFMIVPGRIVL